jgi:hypothetical protein
MNNASNTCILLYLIRILSKVYTIIGVFIDSKDHHDLKFSDLKSRFDEVKSEFVGIVECLTV